MHHCHLIESYRDAAGTKFSLWQRGDYCYELSRMATHVRWFADKSLDETRAILAEEGYLRITA